MHEWSLTMFIELEEELLKEVKKSKIRRKNLGSSLSLNTLFSSSCAVCTCTEPIPSLLGKRI